MNAYLEANTGHNRRKREETLDILEAPEDVDYRVLHDTVMEKLMASFKTCLKKKKLKAAEIIKSTQELLGNGTLITIGVDPQGVELSQADVLATIGEFKETGNLDKEQETVIVDLATDAQIRLIQKLVTLLNLTPETLAISNITLQRILNIPTFKQTELFMATAVYDFVNNATTIESLELLPTEVSTVDLTTSNVNLAEIVNEEQIFEQEIDTLVGVTTEAVTKEDTSVDLSPKNLLTIDRFIMNCDIIKTAGHSAAMLRRNDLLKMDEDEVNNCAEVFGALQMSTGKRAELWTAIKQVTNPLGIKTYTGGEMAIMDNLLPAIAESDPDYPNLREDNIDAISVLGKSSQLLIDEYISANSKSALTQLDIAALGGMLCGLDAVQWKSLVDRRLFAQNINYIAKLDCLVDKEVGEVVYDYLKDSLSEFFSVDLNQPQLIGEIRPNASSILELGWLMGVLPPHLFENLSPDSFCMLPATSVNNLEKLDVLTSNQLSMISPHASTVIKRSQFGQYFDVKQRSALRKSGGESPALMRTLDDYTKEMRQKDEIIRASVVKVEEISLKSSSANFVTTSTILPIFIYFTYKIWL